MQILQTRKHFNNMIKLLGYFAINEKYFFYQKIFTGWQYLKIHLAMIYQ